MQEIIYAQCSAPFDTRSHILDCPNLVEKLKTKILEYQQIYGSLEQRVVILILVKLLDIREELLEDRALQNFHHQLTAHYFAENYIITKVFFFFCY